MYFGHLTMSMFSRNFTLVETETETGIALLDYVGVILLKTLLILVHY